MSASVRHNKCLSYISILLYYVDSFRLEVKSSTVFTLGNTVGLWCTSKGKFDGPSTNPMKEHTFRSHYLIFADRNDIKY